MRMRCEMETSTKCLIWSAIHNYFLSVFSLITFSTAWSQWEDNGRCCFWISYTFPLLYLNLTMPPLLIFFLYKTAVAFQRKSPWPKYQRILNWEVIYWCKSLNLFAFAYWTLAQKLNYIVWEKSWFCMVKRRHLGRSELYVINFPSSPH